jgi:hypothetical protein
MLDEPEVMNAIHDWFMEADDINFSFWKPPLNEERKRAIRRSMSTIDEACNLVLEDFRELGIVCTPWQTIIQALKPFIPNIGSISRITVQAALKRATWEISHRPYGTTRSHVWIVNGEEFHENDHDAKWVAAELARTAEIMKSVSSEPSELNE